MLIMPVTKINIETFLSWSGKYPVIDVRSPAEYNHAHFPGAHSLPLFSDEERKVVGTLYNQESREEAIKKGLEFFGPKMKQIVEDTETIVNKQYAIGKTTTNAKDINLPIANCLLLYCWRGGMRSAGIAWLLDLYGYKVYTLTGGYKSFRRFALNLFSQNFTINILGGYTGSGKTELLHALKQKGETVIDLEALAGHKGSAFGNNLRRKCLKIAWRLNLEK
jgi:tRNA 2-selenouridine synthase